MPKLKYEITQDIENCDQCRFCHKRYSGYSTYSTYELYCLVGSRWNKRLIGTVEQKSYGYITTERPDWCPLVEVKE